MSILACLIDRGGGYTELQGILEIKGVLLQNLVFLLESDSIQRKTFRHGTRLEMKWNGLTIYASYSGPEIKGKEIMHGFAVTFHRDYCVS